MAKSQNNRNAGPGGKPGGSSGPKKNQTGPKVGGKKPAPKNKAIADASKAASGGNSQTTIWIVSAVVVVALAIAGIVAVVNNNSNKAADAAARDLGAGVVSMDGSITWGDEAAPATVEYWGDFLCPACRAFGDEASATIEDAVNDGQARYVFYPVAILNNGTNPTGYSGRAASAMFCAAEEPEGYKFMKALFDGQPPQGGPGLSDEELAELAADVGLNESWNQCYEAGEYADMPLENTQQFDQNGFQGTPTVLVNGSELSSRSAGSIQSAIDAAQA